MRLAAAIFASVVAAAFSAVAAAPDESFVATEPAGFDSFWSDVRAEAGTASLDDVRRTPLAAVAAAGAVPDYAGKGSFSFELSVPGGNSASGFVVLPPKVKEGGCPLVVVFSGYSESDPTPTPRHPIWGLPGMIVVHVSTHGFPLWRDRAFYAQEFDKISAGGSGGEFGFVDEQNESPDTSYFRRIAVRDLAALRFLETLPQWNGKGLTLIGAHLGAWRATAAAANDPKVTGIALWNPWLCDLAPRDDGSRGWLPAWMPGLAFFDGVFLARRVNVPCAIVEAVRDSTVNPARGVSLFHESLAGPKLIEWIEGTRKGSLRVAGSREAGAALVSLSKLGTTAPTAAPSAEVR